MSPALRMCFCFMFLVLRLKRERYIGVAKAANGERYEPEGQQGKRRGGGLKDSSSLEALVVLRNFALRNFALRNFAQRACEESMIREMELTTKPG